MEKKECEKCGSVYELSKSKMIHRDKDDLQCEVCGHTYHSWNEAAFYSGKLVKRGEKK